MQYRALGNTGMSASVIGLGAEYLDGQPYKVVEETIHAALEHDIKIMDVFMPGKIVRENIGKALGTRRKDMIIQGHIGSTDIGQQYDICRDLAQCKQYFEDLMTYLKTDYIDIGMLFFIDSDADFNGVFNSKIADYAMELKKQGIIRAIGASSHNPETAIRVINTGLVEHLLFSINLAFDLTPPEVVTIDGLSEYELGSKDEGHTNPKRAELYRLCERKNVSISVMKTFGAGKLLNADHTPFGKPMTPVQCIHYALTRPAVASVLLGCKSETQIREAVSYLDATDEQRDYSAFAETFRGSFKGHCVYCSHCQPCPSEIDIAIVNKYLDIALLDEKHVPPSIVQHYKALFHTAEECSECGLCEARCPFDVPVIENMNKAQRIFLD